MTLRIDPEKWPEELQALCRERCAEIGEWACFEIDRDAGPAADDYGRVCEECQTELKDAAQ